jgi:hypothetical protein
MFWKFADNAAPNSLATNLRKKRFSFFESLVKNTERPVRILDVGGTAAFWEQMGFPANNEMQITIVNLYPVNVFSPYYSAVVGDGRDLHQFKDGSFDIVFSNSVIEHVGELEDQRRMAMEIARVGSKYFVQTPNKYFPIEPHFLFPGFQFLPRKVKKWLLTHYNLGWFERAADVEEAEDQIDSVVLLTKNQLLELFPGASIYRERFLGLTKSIVVYRGW